LGTNLGDAVGPFESPDSEVPLGEALKVTSEEDVERESASSSGDRDQLGSGFFADFNPKTSGNFAKKRDEDGRSFLHHSFLRNIGGSIARDLRERGAGGVVGTFKRALTAGRALGAEREHFEAGERGGGVTQVLLVRVRSRRSSAA
jgi:hypothetical protein